MGAEAPSKTPSIDLTGGYNYEKGLFLRAFSVLADQ